MIDPDSGGDGMGPVLLLGGGGGCFDVVLCFDV